MDYEKKNITLVYKSIRRPVFDVNILLLGEKRTTDSSNYVA